MYERKELIAKLSQASHADVVKLLANAYKRDEQTRKEVERLLVGDDDYRRAIENELNQKMEGLRFLQAKQVKTLLDDYTKVEKDKRKRIEMFFLFCESTLDHHEKKQIDHRMIQVASSYYGKAVRMMDRELWNEYFERAYQIAERFYNINSRVADQAVIYYQEVKGQYGVPTQED